MAIQDEIREQTKKFKDLTPKEKLKYIWDYYKIPIIVAVAVVIFVAVLVGDIRDNNKPTYINAVFINSNIAADPGIALEDDYLRCTGVNPEEQHVFLSYDYNFSSEYFDTTMMAYQQKLMALYSAQDVDAVIGPVGIMETVADCGGYGDLEKMLPADLIDDLKERGYEFYYYSGRRYSDEEKQYLDEETLKELESFEPYVAGVYLETSSYMNNLGEYGVYSMPESEDDRPIFTIPVNTTRLDHSIELLKFLTE